MIAGSTATIMADNKIAGYPVTIVGGSSNSTAIFARWRDLWVYEWLPTEVAISPFAAFQQAILGVRGWLAWNFAPVVTTSFAIVDSIT